MTLITLATDYGTVDGYVAAVKGAIKSVSSDAEIIDVTHELHSILKAALTLERYCREYPEGTVHVVVVDPTVGSKRRAIAGSALGSYYVGPDNGVLTSIIEGMPDASWHAIDARNLPPGKISATFHGRDIFGPAAAMLAKGVHPADLGPRISDPVKLDIPKPRIEGGQIDGEIIDIDCFGNLVVNIRENVLKSTANVLFEGREIPFVETFSDIPIGYPLSYLGSSGYLEIAVNTGRADEYFRASVGAKVMVKT
jgi:S-adenosylmethionine hydrolase